MLSNTFSRNIESRAVINRCTNEWQSKRHVHRFAKRQTFDRNHSLIMIARNHAIKLSARCAQKDRIGGKRTTNIDVIVAATTLDGGNDFGCFFDSEESA